MVAGSLSAGLSAETDGLTVGLPSPIPIDS